MTLPCLLILALLSADPSGSDSMDSMSRGEAAMQRLTALQPAEQREWLLKLEKRLDRANQLNLKAEDAEKERLRTAALFKQKQITAEFLQSLIDQTDEREYEAICRMAREYRKQVLAVFDGQKDKIAEYQNAGEKVYESWQLAGEPFEQQELILDWLEKAIRSTASKNLGPLPPSPKFSSCPKATSAKTIEKKPDPVLPSPETPAKPTTPAIAPRNNPPIKKSADVSAVHVNHGELSARIAGLNMNLRALETELDERKNWDVAQLTAKIAKTKTTRTAAEGLADRARLVERCRAKIHREIAISASRHRPVGTQHCQSSHETDGKKRRGAIKSSCRRSRRARSTFQRIGRFGGGVVLWWVEAFTYEF